MAVRNVVTIGDDLLRKRSRPVTNFDEKLEEILDDMKQTMIKCDGVGLAAVQVGILRRIVVIDVNGMSLELINPIITKRSGKQCLQEGCLSVPERSGYVERPFKITVKAFDRHGNEFELTVCEYAAVCICHELDHLDGILFIDKLVPKPEDKDK